MTLCVQRDQKLKELKFPFTCSHFITKEKEVECLKLNFEFSSHQLALNFLYCFCFPVCRFELHLSTLLLLCSLLSTTTINSGASLCAEVEICLELVS